jgi:hypothetical protein
MEDLIEIFPHLSLVQIRSALAEHKTVDKTVAALLEAPLAASTSAASARALPPKIQGICSSRSGDKAVAPGVLVTPSLASRHSDAIAHSHAAKATARVLDEESVAVLQSMFPEMPPEAVQFALRNRGGNCEDAAAYSAFTWVCVCVCVCVCVFVCVRVRVFNMPPTTTHTTSPIL